MPVEFQFDFPKVKAALLFMDFRGVPALDKYKICKLFFLADKYHLVKYGRTITGDKYCALPYGPIPSTILDMLDGLISGNLYNENVGELAASVALDRQYVNPRFKAITAYDANELSKSDFAALDHVISDFGRMGFAELRAITHEMAAYKKAWHRRPEGYYANDMKFEEFFEEDSDAVTGAFEEMLEDNALRNTFTAR
jgi:uncharacterized phage-associated protein